jgi:hypothetical protein
MTFNDWTLVVYLSTWGVLVVWELITLFRRWRCPGTGQKTISAVLRDQGWRMSSVVFSSTSMPAHWWLNADAWGPEWLGGLFWFITAALLGWNLYEWKRPAPRRWWHSPVLWLAAGALAGRFLFPQAEVAP